MKYTIEVTSEDIANGIRMRACLCPVAIAIQRITKRYAGVCQSYVDFPDENGRLVTLNAPTSVNDFIKKFDSSKEVEPFIFQLDSEDKYKPIERPRVESTK